MSYGRRCAGSCLRRTRPGRGLHCCRPSSHRRRPRRWACTTSPSVLFPHPDEPADGPTSRGRQVPIGIAKSFDHFRNIVLVLVHRADLFVIGAVGVVGLAYCLRRIRKIGTVQTRCPEGRLRSIFILPRRFWVRRKGVQARTHQIQTGQTATDRAAKQWGTSRPTSAHIPWHFLTNLR